MGEMESFAQTLLHSATCAHIQHWQTTSYAEHKALQKYYESMPDLVDDLVETYMGRNGLVGEFEPEFYIEKNPLKYMKAMRDYVDDTRKDLPKGSEIQNLVDGITDLINSTIYKLENLK